MLAQDLRRQAFVALERGDANAAHAAFALWANTETGDLDALMGLAVASGMMGDTHGRLSALDRLLARQPGNLQALMMKADHFAEAGDGRAAQAFYAMVARMAPPIHSLPEEARLEVQRAAAKAERYGRAFASHLEQTLGGVQAGERFAHSVEMLLGREPLFVQQPTTYYFPGLPQRAFYERQEFPWTTALERQTEAIREELVAVMREDGAFQPYIEEDPSRPPGDFGVLKNNTAWSAFRLIDGGRLVEDAVARCPRTMAALAAVPLTDAEGRTPSVLFSLLRPGAHIHPHNGQINARLICHLPLIVPEGCRLRVGAEIRPWVTGETLIFDDSIEHEAWNDSAETRVVLLFEVWKPELNDAERAAVAMLLSAVGEFRG